MPQSPGDILSVSFRGTIQGQRTINTLYYRAVTSNPTSDNTIYNAILDAIRSGAGGADLLETDYLACCAQNFTLNEIRVQFIAPTRKRMAILSRALPGTVGFDQEVTQLCGVITKQTSLAGRRYVGSVHLPMPESEVNDGLIDPAHIARLSAFATKMLSSLATVPGDSYLPCLYHAGQVPDYTYLEETVVQDTARVMRRRGLRLGE